MDPFLIPQVIDLAGENPAKTYRQPLASGDSAAHRWEVRVVRAGAAADLTGCSAAVLARREGEDSSPTVRQKADITGNVASAEFIPEVYALGGRILAMMVISGSDGRVITAAVLRLQGKTYTTDTICDPEGTIPSLEALLARYEDMVAATGESRAATQAAQQATEETRAALSDAQAALATAQQAVTDAQGAVGTAQTAADTANAAAVKIDDMTVSATPLSAGTASAALTLVDGHYHLTLGLPKGDTGATPQISVQVTTGAAGSEASVSVSGTAEEPVIHLTIPRGDTGAIENMTINGKPVESGNITLTPEDLGAASAQEVSQLKDEMVNYRTAVNLLDNSHWENPKEVVNQRGETSKQADWVYWIDRWQVNASHAAISLVDGGIRVPAQVDKNLRLVQRVPLEKIQKGRDYTIAVCESDGTVRCASGIYNGIITGDGNGDNLLYVSLQDFDGSTFYYFIVDSYKDVVLRWAALYEGSYTAETLPPYVPKENEIISCRKYYREYGDDGIYCYCYTNDYLTGFDFDIPMRIAPTISECSILRLNGFESMNVGASTFTTAKGVTYIHCPGAVAGEWYRITSLKLDADL